MAYHARRLKMGQTAKARAEAEQTWAHRIREYDAILHNLLPKTSEKAGKKLLSGWRIPQYEAAHYFSY